MSRHDLVEPFRGQGRPGDNGPAGTTQIQDLTLNHLTVGQFQDAGHPAEEIDATTRSVDQDDSGLRETDRQRYAGETDTGTQIPDLLLTPIEKSSEQHRIPQVSAIDPGYLAWADSSRGDPFAAQPKPKSGHFLDLSLIEGDTGVCCRPKPGFHVKQGSPGVSARAIETAKTAGYSSSEVKSPVSDSTT